MDITRKLATIRRIAERIGMVSFLGIGHAPICLGQGHIRDKDLTALLALADQRSQLYDTPREGLVYKSLSDPNKSFKVISNAWLLKSKE